MKLNIKIESRANGYDIEISSGTFSSDKYVAENVESLVKVVSEQVKDRCHD